MVRGIYTAASGMLVQSVRTDVTANNLANVDTVGFHRQDAHVRSFPEMLLDRLHKGERVPIGFLGTGAVVDGGRFSFAPGKLNPTGNPLDVALFGTGFFVVDTPEGNRYTRNGQFVVDEAGILVNDSGLPVLGQNGPISMGTGPVVFESDGGVRVDGVLVDRLLLVDFVDRDALQRTGYGLYAVDEEAEEPLAFEGVVVSGTLEMSNVQVVREMVHLIEVQRSYEANQKVIQAYDETLGKAVNEIAGK